MARLKLVLQFNEGSIGTVEATRQNLRNVRERDRILRKQVRRVGYMKLRGLQRTHVRRVWLIYKADSSPNTAPGSATLAISILSLTIATAPFLRISSRPLLELAAKTVSPAW